jgi:hypothetical protein
MFPVTRIALAGLLSLAIATLARIEAIGIAAARDVDRPTTSARRVNCRVRRAESSSGSCYGRVQTYKNGRPQMTPFGGAGLGWTVYGDAQHDLPLYSLLEER